MIILALAPIRSANSNLKANDTIRATELTGAESSKAGLGQLAYGRFGLNWDKDALGQTSLSLVTVLASYLICFFSACHEF